MAYLCYLYLFHIATVFFISLVAFERYMAICRPAIHRQTNSRTRAFRLLLMSWIASFVTVACYSGAFSVNMVCIAWPDDALNLVPIYFRTCKGSDLAKYSLVIIDVGFFSFYWHVSATVHCTYVSYEDWLNVHVGQIHEWWPRKETVLLLCLTSTPAFSSFLSHQNQSEQISWFGDRSNPAIHYLIRWFFPEYPSRSFHNISIVFREDAQYVFKL